MDKNTITGLVLIFIILIGFSYFTRPSEQELRQIALRDSLARVENAKKTEFIPENGENSSGISAPSGNLFGTEPAKNSVFTRDSSCTEAILTLENDKIKAGLSTKGGKLVSLELKEYRTFDSLPLMLTQKDFHRFGLNFYAKNQEIKTENLIFKGVKTINGDSQILSMRLYAKEDAYLEFSYSLARNSYMVDFSIKAHNLRDIISAQSSFLTMYWGNTLAKLEKSKEFENRYTGIYYNFYGNDVNRIVSDGDKTEKLQTKVKWVAFKQQFFSSVLVAEDSFNDVEIHSKALPDEDLLKEMETTIPLAYNGEAEEEYRMKFFFGPNAYDVLNTYGKDIDLPGLLNLGWNWISWISKYVIIPIFHFLKRNTPFNYGIIILLLTLIIKIVIFPLTFKSYISQAKMRVLKPQIDEINRKYSKEQALEKQKATMELYKRAGVNPMGGCLPMLLQFPILISMFYFFPGAIELRQQSFLWAEDLASYDSILNLPFRIPGYGSHVSLFCLLMTVVNIVYMRMNNKNQPQNDQMKSMQMMMYIMPVMFLFIFNSYSAALSYYYLIATLITIFQTWIIRKFVDDEKLLQKIELAKSKPLKKSKFRKRLEEMQRMQQQKQRRQKR